MTDLDLDAIRRIADGWNAQRGTVLLALCNEVERLRGERENLAHLLRHAHDLIDGLRAERDALRVDNDRLRRNIHLTTTGGGDEQGR